MSKQLGLYIHIPFCKSKCDYCDFYSFAGPGGAHGRLPEGPAHPH
ncbi:MAG: hypothetical protein ACLSAF_20225 [Intestinimonas sp.]